MMEHLGTMADLVVLEADSSMVNPAVRDRVVQRVPLVETAVTRCRVQAAQAVTLAPALVAASRLTATEM